MKKKKYSIKYNSLADRSMTHICHTPTRTLCGLELKQAREAVEFNHDPTNEEVDMFVSCELCRDVYKN